MILGCNVNSEGTAPEIKKGMLLDGLYVVKNLDSDSNFKAVWIFRNDTHFSLKRFRGNYSDDELGIPG